MEGFYHYIVSPLMIFVGGFLLLRLAGKKSVSEMNHFDLLFILLLGNNFTESLYDNRTMDGIYFGLVFVLFYIGFARASLNNKLRWLIISSPTVLIRNGDIDEKGLKKARITTDELLGNLRKKGYVRTADIELAIMENMGEMSVIPKAEVRPLQPSDLQLQPSPTFIPIPLIMNGQILQHNMKFLNKDENWLYEQLRANGLTENQIDEVTLAVYNQQGFLEVDTDKETHHHNNPYAYKPGNQN